MLFLFEESLLRIAESTLGICSSISIELARVLKGEHGVSLTLHSRHGELLGLAAHKHDEPLKSLSRDLALFLTPEQECEEHARADDY